MDILLMIVIHFSIFFLYSVTSTHYTSNHHNQNHHPLHKPLQPQSKLDMHFFTKYHNGEELGNSAYHGLLDGSDHQHYEANYPKKSRTEDFPTKASQAEMAKHDRYIVHGLFYTNLLTSKYLDKHWSQPCTKESVPFHPQNLCMTIFMKNRSIPYVNALMMSLMGSHNEGEELEPKYKRGRGSGGHRLLSYAQVNLIDTETKNWDYDEARQKILNLPFVYQYTSRRRMSWLKSERLEILEKYLLAARICHNSGLDWCLMMEEYTIVPINFVLKLKKFVTGALQSHINAHISPNQSSEQLLAKTFSVISLFSSYNKDSGAPMMPHNVEYSQETYESDRTKLNAERYRKNLAEHHDVYELKPIHQGDDGSNVAMLFTRHVTSTQLIPMLEKLHEAEMKEVFWKSIFTLTGDYHSTRSDTETAYFDLEKEFALYTGVSRFRTEPSIVNRIGFYDEFYPGYNKDVYDENIGITNWLTDSRFVFDAGVYWDDSVEYCLNADNNWIYDPYQNDEKDSCCNPKSDCAKKRKKSVTSQED